MRTPRTLVALLLLAAAACHDDALSATDPALSGDWGPPTLPVGSRWSMRLAVRGPSITGTGEYALEAGRSGTLAVTGTVTGGQVTLDITYDYGMKEHFVGVHTSADVLHGTSRRALGADTTSSDTDFRRRATP